MTVRASQIPISMESPGEILLKCTFLFRRSGWSQRDHIFNKLPRGGDAASLWPHFEKQGFKNQKVSRFCVVHVFTNIKQNQKALVFRKWTEKKKKKHLIKYNICNMKLPPKESYCQVFTISSSALLAFSFLTNLDFWSLKLCQTEACFSPHCSWV